MTALLAELHLSGGAFALSLAAVFIGAVIQTVTGQAFGMIVAPALALAAPERLPATTLLLGGALTMMAAVSTRGEIAWRELVPATIGRLAGAVAASLVIGWLASTDGIPQAVAISVLVAVGLSLSGLRLAITWRTLLAAGALSGAMATFTSIGAPPMGLLYQRERAAKTRATLNLFFFLGVLFSLAALAPHGLLRHEDLIFALALAPGMAAGLLLGRAVVTRTDRLSLRPAILAFATVSALIILF